MVAKIINGKWVNITREGLAKAPGTVNGRMQKPYKPKTREECRTNQYNKAGGRMGKNQWGDFKVVTITPRQRDVYLFLKYFWDEYGYSPTYQEIANALGLVSKESIRQIVERLCEKGYVTHTKRSMRTIVRSKKLDRDQHL